MAQDMFIKIGDIKGEAQDSKHKDEIDILSWSWGMTQTGNTHLGSGGGAGKVQVADLTFMKHVDRASPILLLHCASGKVLKQAVLVVRKAGGNAVEYLKISMADLIITAVTHGGGGNDELLTENVTLNFASVKFEYSPQKNLEGSPEPSITMGYDIKGQKLL